MAADVDVFQGLNGVQGDGSPRPWAWVHVRARTVLGYASKRVPFSRDLGGGRKTPSTPSALDHIIGTAEQVAPRYVASDGNVWDLHDYLRVSVEKLIADTDPAKLADLRAKAGVLRAWPAGFAGKPDFE